MELIAVGLASAMTGSFGYFLIALVFVLAFPRAAHVIHMLLIPLSAIGMAMFFWLWAYFFASIFSPDMTNSLCSINLFGIMCLGCFPICYKLFA